MIAWIFYRSAFGLLIFFPFAFLNHRRIRADREGEKRRRFHRQFREFLNSLSSALSSGSSVERAFLQAERDQRSLFPEDAVFLPDLHDVNGQVKLGLPVEKAFWEFAEKWPFEEVTAFAEIFSFAKRLGGDYGANIRKTAAGIGDRMEIVQEIEAMSAEKQMELKLMSAMPAAIMVYITAGSPDFLQASYHNPAGILVMTGCLGLYGGAVLLGRHMIRRQVAQ